MIDMEDIVSCDSLLLRPYFRILAIFLAMEICTSGIYAHVTLSKHEHVRTVY